MHTVPEIFNLISSNMEKVVKGKPDVIRQILLCFFSRGHLLIEDVPGTGKTLLSKSFACSLDIDFSRIQFTSDLLPSDLLGVSIWKPSKDEFEFYEGPIFSSLVLADEINRASPRTQSALLEAMSELQVTIEGTTRILPEPFMVIATQNLLETHGVYPLPENQLDRFLSVISVGYPDSASEEEMLETHQLEKQLEELSPVVDQNAISLTFKNIAEVHVADTIRRYLVALANASREHGSLQTGISPRATLSLQRIAQTHAAAEGRNFVTPEDIQPLLHTTVAHRLHSSSIAGQSVESILDDILRSVPTPSISDAQAS